MGLLDDYDINLDEVEAIKAGGGYAEIPEGVYAFTVAQQYKKFGTRKDEKKVNIIIEYHLEDGPEDGIGETHREFFGMPKDPQNLTKNDKLVFGFYKQRMIDFGFDPSEIASLDGSESQGIKGIVELKKNAAGYLQVHGVTTEYTSLEELEGAVDAGQEESEKAALDAAVAAPVARRRAAPAQEVAPAAPAAPAATAAPSGAAPARRRNPFPAGS